MNTHSIHYLPHIFVIELYNYYHENLPYIDNSNILKAISSDRTYIISQNDKNTIVISAIGNYNYYGFKSLFPLNVGILDWEYSTLITEPLLLEYASYINLGRFLLRVNTKILWRTKFYAIQNEFLITDSCFSFFSDVWLWRENCRENLWDDAWSVFALPFDNVETLRISFSFFICSKQAEIKWISILN